MSNPFFEHPILNSPYACPQRHWELDADLLAAFPNMRGFSVVNMWRMKQFYLAHSTPEFLAKAVRELVATVPGGHHVVLLGKLAAPAARLYYLRATARFDSMIGKAIQS